ncbi:hypothetical protein COU54_00840 [Candidatus Pacearchaeota archaeon CG10_big_fil_rev_8_21_14_0_10_31_24]|nr:MAG: hypothetical protein COU54_00840 [Candidatus Pacearchaeota archaeon CG10_big_fil_rev_8_21_14_0_10_31_24]
MSESIQQESKEKTNLNTLKPKDVEKLVIELYRKEKSLAKVGLILRDKHGVPRAKLVGKKIKKILEDAGEPIISEKEIVQKKIKKLEEHRKKNKHDYTAQRSLAKKLWVAHKLK